MPARNLYHDEVVAALTADGWTVTDDPLWLKYPGRNVYIDLGAEQTAVTAEKGGRRIAVEVQTFAGPSDVRDLQQAVGQYGMYRHVLTRTEPDRELYMAVHEDVADGILAEPLGEAMLADFRVKVLVFDPNTRRVIRWTS